MSPLDEIKTELTSEKASLSNTLRKAKILASKIGLVEFKEWLKYELEGYPSKEKLPEYRKMKVQNSGTFAGPFHSMATNVPFPTYNLPENVREFAENMLFYDGVSGLEAMLKTEGDFLERRWPPEAVLIAREKVALSGGMVLIDAKQPFGKHMIEGILDNVKNRLLDFVLAIEESSIDIDRKGIPDKEKDQIRNMFNFNIYGSNNVVAAGETVRQDYRAVATNDVESLLGYFSQFDVEKSDLQSLKDAIKADGKPKGETFGTRVLTWIGTMVSKAASGVWNVALTTAPVILTEALKKYYGI